MFASVGRPINCNAALGSAASEFHPRRGFAETCRRHRRPFKVVGAATSSGAVPTKANSSWADEVLMRLVNAAIETPPIFAAMKFMARQTMISTAEKKGVNWKQNVADLERSQVYSVKAEIENPGLTYPSYYLQPFHAYSEGNLSWQAAFEVEPAADVIALRVWPSEQLTPQEARTRLRTNVFSALRHFYAKNRVQEPQDILDIGCSVGIGTRWMAGEFPQSQVTAMDLSPHMLAVAELRERQLEAQGALGGRRRINYIHANMDDSGLPSSSFDLVTVQFVMHECPAAVTANLVTEALRLLRPGGVLAFVDNNPQSQVTHNLPPWLYSLLRSTEPWSDEYSLFDVEACMSQNGFSGVQTFVTDPRNRVVAGVAPLL